MVDNPLWKRMGSDVARAMVIQDIGRTSEHNAQAEYEKRQRAIRRTDDLARIDNMRMEYLAQIDIMSGRAFYDYQFQQLSEEDKEIAIVEAKKEAEEIAR